MSKFAKPKSTNYNVNLCEAFAHAPFLAGVPPVTQWLRAILRQAYGEKHDQVLHAYQTLVAALDETPGANLPEYGTTIFGTDSGYRRDERTYSVSFRYAEGYCSPAKAGEKHLDWAEALMLRENMLHASFSPEERDPNYVVRHGYNRLDPKLCPEMCDWLEQAQNYVELALEYTLYLHRVSERLRLPKKWSPAHILSTINPEWGAKHHYESLSDVTSLRWRNATSPATNRAIYKMLDDMTLIGHGKKELPFLSVQANMKTEDGNGHGIVCTTINIF